MDVCFTTLLTFLRSLESTTSGAVSLLMHEASLLLMMIFIRTHAQCVLQVDKSDLTLIPLMAGAPRSRVEPASQAAAAVTEQNWWGGAGMPGRLLSITALSALRGNLASATNDLLLRMLFWCRSC